MRNSSIRLLTDGLESCFASVTARDTALADGEQSSKVIVKNLVVETPCAFSKQLHRYRKIASSSLTEMFTLDVL